MAGQTSGSRVERHTKRLTRWWDGGNYPRMTLPSTPLGPLLVVEDEPEIALLLSYHLSNAGYRVATAADGRQGLQMAAESPPALLILDLMLPDMSGFDVLEELRTEPSTKNTAVLMLTALREDADRIRGLSLGADDYLTKPFNPEEVVLRVGAILRRANNGTVRKDVLTVGPIEIDRRAHRVTVGGTGPDLTATEYRLLLLLADHAGDVLTRSQLLGTIWDAQPGMNTRTVDVHVQRLRTKLGPAGEMVETVRGFGYRLRTPVAA